MLQEAVPHPSVASESVSAGEKNIRYPSSGEDMVGTRTVAIGLLLVCGLASGDAQESRGADASGVQDVRQPFSLTSFPAQSLDDLRLDTRTEELPVDVPTAGAMEASVQMAPASGPVCALAEPPVGTFAPIDCNVTVSPNSVMCRRVIRRGGVEVRRCGCASCKLDACYDNLCYCDPCSHGLWVRTDYLLWWAKEDGIPPLVTSSPAGTPVNEVGVLGEPNTSVLFDGPLADGIRSGGRVRFGFWIDDCCRWGIDGSLLGIENLKDGFEAASGGDPALARPFFNVDPAVNAPDAELVSYNGLLNGGVAVNSSSELYSGNLGVRHNLCCWSDRCGPKSRRVDFLAGYRYLRVREGLQIAEALEVTGGGGPLAVGTTIDLFDRFRTTNEFHGGEIGLNAAVQRGRLSLELQGSVALGNLERVARIDGQTTTTVPAVPPFSRTGGLLAQTTNIGRYEDNEFAALPEFQANVGFQIHQHLKLLAGYTFLYLGDVVRPGDVVDPVVNGTLLDPNVPFAGAERPQFSWDSSDLWVMGVNLGLECRF